MSAAGAVSSLLLADSRFPAGTYAHSLGLEQAVVEGLDVDGVAPFMSARLRLVAQPDAALSVAARRAAATGVDGATGACHLAELDAEHAARCPSPVLRDVARRLGSQLLRSAATAWPCGTIDRYRADSATTPRPVALGVVGAVAGLSDLEVAMVALYDDAATVACAALKLLGLDPAQTTRWLAELAPRIGTMAGEVADDTRPVAQQPPPAAIAIELAAARHAARRERFFVS
ncbi:MAG TPA: urease accessory UreF family protein [Solirubrobacteraceae bacterium]|jgi:urease accessory protein|nr:urease accessory UreF family protein [Solirubrobacteraceae bacterium]